MSINFNIMGITSTVNAGSGKYYIAPTNDNAIFLVDTEEWSIKWVCDIPWKNPFVAVDIMAYEQVIWCVARKGLQIACYDLECKTISVYYDVDADRDNLTAILIEKDIYIFPKNLPDNIIKFSIEEKKYYVLKEWSNQLNDLSVWGHIRAYTVYQKKIAVTMSDKTSILIFDIKEKTTREIKTNINDEFFGIAVEDNGYCVTSRNSKKIYFLDENTKEIKIYENQDIGGYYNQIFRVKNQYILSGVGGIDIFFDESFKSIQKNIHYSNEDLRSPYIHVSFNNERIIMWPWNAKFLLEMDQSNQQIVERSLHFDFADFVHFKPILQESDLPLDAYIEELIKFIQ